MDCLRYTNCCYQTIGLRTEDELVDINFTQRRLIHELYSWIGPKLTVIHYLDANFHDFLWIKMATTIDQDLIIYEYLQNHLYPSTQ